MPYLLPGVRRTSHRGNGIWQSVVENKLQEEEQSAFGKVKNFFQTGYNTFKNVAIKVEKGIKKTAKKGIKQIKKTAKEGVKQIKKASKQAGNFMTQVWENTYTRDATKEVLFPHASCPMPF